MQDTRTPSLGSSINPPMTSVHAAALRNNQYTNKKSTTFGPCFSVHNLLSGRAYAIALLSFASALPQILRTVGLPHLLFTLAHRWRERRSRWPKIITKEKQKMTSYERTICGPCIHKFNNSGLYKATEIGPRHKCFCEECGGRAYGARCRIEITAGPRPRAEQNRRS